MHLSMSQFAEKLQQQTKRKHGAGVGAHQSRFSRLMMPIQLLCALIEDYHALCYLFRLKVTRFEM